MSFLTLRFYGCSWSAPVARRVIPPSCARFWREWSSEVCFPAFNRNRIGAIRRPAMLRNTRTCCAFSAETCEHASSLLHTLLRRQPQSADAWHVLGDLLWKEAEKERALLCFRIASSLALANEHYALAYANTLAQSHREEDGFAWLESRVRKFG